MSSQSDHDRALERLLRTRSGEPAEPTPACIDAERLAAWSDGGLTPAERDAIDAHLASCTRCLAMLGVFSAIHTGSVAAHEGSVPTHEVGLPHEGSVPAHEVGRTPRGPLPSRTRRDFPRVLRWVVPMTSAAAAVLIWMVLPARPPEPAFAPSTQVARDETTLVTPAAPPPQRFDAPSGDQVRESAPSLTPAAPAQPPRALSKSIGPADEAERRREQTAATDSVRQAPAEAPAAKASDTAASAGQRAANEGAMSDRMAAARPSAAPPPAAPAPPPPPVAGLMRAEAAVVEVRSPDPAHRWRIRGALVEQSTNGGASWQPATIPAGVVITAGTSPAADICWLVGANGTVIRTANGSRFEAVSIPAAGALVSVQATDGTRATVRAANGRVYVTEDGGRSWK